jgi:hypothetical protein
VKIVPSRPLHTRVQAIWGASKRWKDCLALLLSSPLQSFIYETMSEVACSVLHDRQAGERQAL